MGSITKLLDDDCRKIVEENAEKVGFSKAFHEMKFSMMPKPPKYNTRASRNSNSLSPEQKQIELLSSIYEDAKSTSKSEKNVIKKSPNQTRINTKHCKSAGSAILRQNQSKQKTTKYIDTVVLRQSQRIAANTIACVV